MINIYSKQVTYQITHPRSLKAHLKSSFEVVGSLEYGGAEWDLVLWDWKA